MDVVRTAMKMGRPMRPTIGYVSRVVAATRSGGCGFWYGLGSDTDVVELEVLAVVEKRSWSTP